jgi:2-C-methyl-D-erythritol 4-phosphate cytidylyltransferase
VTQEAVAIVLAAGTSQRMGGADKIWADLAGRPVLARSLAIFASVAAVTRIVVVAPAEARARCRVVPGA